MGLDTNVLLRWLVTEDIWPDDAPEQTSRVSEILLAPKTIFFVNLVVLAETAWVLGRPMKQPKDIVMAVVHRLLYSTNIVVESRSAATAALESYARGSGDFADHLIGQINRIQGCETTLTFDRKASRTGLFRDLRNVSE